MKYGTAPASLGIKLISSLVVLMTGGFLAASLVQAIFLWPAALLLLVTMGCYLRTPVAYEITPEGLTVWFRLGSKSFGPILTAAPVEPSAGWSIRLWGNGGLFAGTGLFWNRTWGIFRAYVTTSNPANLVLLETPDGKVLISPDRPGDVLTGGAGLG